MFLGLVFSVLLANLMGVMAHGKLPKVFTTRLRFEIPFSDLRQEITAVIDKETTRAHIGYYDEDDATHKLVEYDYTIWGREGEGYTYYNGRYAIDHQYCECTVPGSHLVLDLQTGETLEHAMKKMTPITTSKVMSNDSPLTWSYDYPPEPIDNLIPETLDHYTLMNEKVSIHGRMMSHYVFNAEYKPDYDDSTNNTYGDKKAYQQNFYCLEDGKTGYCIPHMWEMFSKSNFGSHFDTYRVDYLSFDLTIDETAFNIPKECVGTETCIAPPKPNPDDPTPPGPTVKYPIGFLPHKVLNYHVRAVTSNENMIRASVLMRNQRMIAEWNARPDAAYTTGLNRFATLTPGEARRMFTGKRNVSAFRDINTENDEIFDYKYDIELPESVDWRVSGVDGTVKDQCACGSCWVFSAVGSIEGRLNKKRLEDKKNSEPLVRISEQAVLSCFWDDKLGQGCNGGDPMFALKSITEKVNGKLTLERDYIYKGMDTPCKKELFKDIDNKYYVCNPKRIKSGSLNALKRALVDGPVEVSIAVPQSLLYYTGGIYNPPVSECGNRQEDLAHGVTAVGYGVDEKYGEYIIVKNSWSPLWGQDGYAYIATRNNTCGILTDATFADICVRNN